MALGFRVQGWVQGYRVLGAVSDRGLDAETRIQAWIQHSFASYMVLGDVRVLGFTVLGLGV